MAPGSRHRAELQVPTAVKVAVLSGPPTCPEHFAQVYALETRMSWVFPADTYAYKLKKPARRDCPDFSAIELRHMDRDAEVTLNQPPAPDI